MNPIVRLSRQLACSLIALLLAGFALAQRAQAVGPEPSERQFARHAIQQDDAVAEPGSDTEEAALGQAANNPNQRVIKINSTFCQCAGASEKVNLRGEFRISFEVGEFLGVRGVVRPVLPVKLSTGFNGTCPSTKETCLVGVGTKTGRQYEAKRNLKPITSSSLEENKWKVSAMNGMGSGRFLMGLVVTAEPNSPPNAEANPKRVVRWTLLYRIHYEWGPDKKVKSFKVTAWDVCGHP